MKSGHCYVLSGDSVGSGLGRGRETFRHVKVLVEAKSCWVLVPVSASEAIFVHTLGIRNYISSLILSKEFSLNFSRGYPDTESEEGSNTKCNKIED